MILPHSRIHSKHQKYVWKNFAQVICYLKFEIDHNPSITGQALSYRICELQCPWPTLHQSGECMIFNTKIRRDSLSLLYCTLVWKRRFSNFRLTFYRISLTGPSARFLNEIYGICFLVVIYCNDKNKLIESIIALAIIYPI